MNANSLKRGALALVCAMALPALAMAQGGSGGNGNGNGGGQGGQGSGGNSVLIQYFDSLPLEPVGPIETLIVQHMREEEKMARDVYRVLHSTWQLPVFANIVTSEQEHMDLVKRLLDRYQIPDPVRNNATGVFSDPSIAALYQALVTFGSLSPVNALLVGALIEDVDLFDLNVALLFSDNRDFDLIWQNLSKGSRNHMRAFHGNLQANGITYAPFFLDLATFTTIVTTPMERGVVYDENGNVL